MKNKLHQRFARLLPRLERRIAALENLSRKFSRARLVLVLLGVVLVYLTSQFFNDAVAWTLFFLLTSAFAVLAQRHNRVEQSLARHRIWHRLKGEHAARMALHWEKIPKPDLTPEAGTHPFAADLNILGERSLLHLLDTTTALGGSKRLRTWLLHPHTDPALILQRQNLIRELQPLATFRDRLALHGALLRSEASGRWEGEQLQAWLQRAGNPAKLRNWTIGLAMLAALNLGLFVLRQFELVPLLWPFTVMAYGYAYVLHMRDLRRLFDEAFHLEKSLRPFQIVARYLEQHPYTRAPHLMQICAPFRRPGGKPSHHLKRAAAIAQAASMQRGQMFWLLLNLLMPWDFYFWYRLEQAKSELKTHLPVWLEAWYELEAYNALANFAYLHPDYIFPEVRADHGPPLLSARALGHPLLPEAARVCNDFAIAQLGEIALITGSNMSGKSTFLRTVGVNLCLAYCGAPVNAAQLQTAPFRLFTCMAVSDSVTDGISFFYAEVKRLKTLLHELHGELYEKNSNLREVSAPPSSVFAGNEWERDRVNSNQVVGRDDNPLAPLKGGISERPSFSLATTELRVPLLFLVDEIFRGTNNRERLIGSRAYIRALAQGRGCGMISTHDLELVELAHEIATLHNYHFRESVSEGRMIFDYLLREGPCPTTNALKIMQLEGLPIA